MKRHHLEGPIKKVEMPPEQQGSIVEEIGQWVEAAKQRPNQACALFTNKNTWVSYLEGNGLIERKKTYYFTGPWEKLISFCQTCLIIISKNSESELRTDRLLASYQWLVIVSIKLNGSSYVEKIARDTKEIAYHPFHCPPLIFFWHSTFLFAHSRNAHFSQGAP